MPPLPRMLVLLLVACNRDRGTTAPVPVDPQPPGAAASGASAAPPAPTPMELPGEPGNRPEPRVWDDTNLERLLGYWRDIACFRARVRAAGEAARGSQPGGYPDEVWYQFKTAYVGEVDAWQQALFASEPRVLERSQLIAWIIQGLEIVAHGYPRAFSDGGDATEISRYDAQWETVEREVQGYAQALGGAWNAPIWPGARHSDGGRSQARIAGATVLLGPLVRPPTG